jgi:hypothetical protein
MKLPLDAARVREGEMMRGSTGLEDLRRRTLISPFSTCMLPKKCCLNGRQPAQRHTGNESPNIGRPLLDCS